jgi:hypothetical protein
MCVISPLLTGSPWNCYLRYLATCQDILRLSCTICRKFRNLKAELLEILFHKRTIEGRLQNWKVCVSCLCLRPRTDILCHSSSHKDKSSLICMLHFGSANIPAATCGNSRPSQIILSIITHSELDGCIAHLRTLPILSEAYGILLLMNCRTVLAMTPAQHTRRRFWRTLW